MKVKKTGRSMLDFIQAAARKELTKAEFTRIRNEGTEEELIEALEQMEAQGGYENLG